MMKNLVLRPNSSAFAGLNANYRKLNFYLETSIPNTSLVDRKMTKVRSFAFYVNYFKPKWGITGIFIQNQGFLMPSMNHYEDRNYLRMNTIGANVYYFFNVKTFSFAAANSLTKLKTKSRGSFVVITSPMYRILRSDKSIVPDSIGEYHFTGNLTSSKQMQLISLQCKPGYIHNFVFHEGRYFISPALYAGLGMDYNMIQHENHTISGLNLNVGMRGKLVAGMNSLKYFLSIKILIDRTVSKLYRSKLLNYYSEMSLTVGFRF